ncbi:MAG: hypothetical protein QXP36_11265 [Conexivisphaerales archaeon]
MNLEHSVPEKASQKTKYAVALIAFLLLLVIIAVVLYHPSGKPDPKVLSYEMHPSGDYCVFYVCLTNKGGDGEVKVTCVIDCMPVDPFPSEHQEVTPDGTVITYRNGTLPVIHVSINPDGTSTMEEVPEPAGFITLTKSIVIYLRSKETTTIQVMVRNPPVTIASTKVYASVKD